VFSPKKNMLVSGATAELVAALAREEPDIYVHLRLHAGVTSNRYAPLTVGLSSRA
jgi:hypothetical protein